MVTPKRSIITHTAKKIKNKILAIDAAPAAIPVKPNTAATIAIIKNANDQRNIMLNFRLMNNLVFKMLCHIGPMLYLSINVCQQAL